MAMLYLVLTSYGVPSLGLDAQIAPPLPEPAPYPAVSLIEYTSVNCSSAGAPAALVQATSTCVPELPLFQDVSWQCAGLLPKAVTNTVPPALVRSGKVAE